MVPCLYYIQGIVEGRPDNSGICLNSNIAWATVIRAYVKTMEDHPTLMDEPRGMGVIVSLMAYFPCKTKSAISPPPHP